ncbi:diguanylate cyclase [Vibrio sp. YMD68]|uniref:sensor domain-containing diguanylate cyclase n=1 Tax=Vibrio sp. YMD68 TaxID=3042300 RepID=UPI00249A55E6|nr:diguanylate cyclase [Vibrio sp. YMD68]WGW01053.1 diguanylate cyclase [Vibrio sp. YMD68]
MSFSNWSMRALSGLMSFLIVVMFLSAYFAFKYLWSHDAALAQVESIQKRELQQVYTMLDLAKSDLQGKLEDYAAWDSMAEFADDGNVEFTKDDLNIHTLVSMSLEAVFVFSQGRDLVYSKRYDHRKSKEIEVGSELENHLDLLLDLGESMPTEEISSVTRLLAFEDQAYIFSLSRICNSDAYECDKGFVIFISPLEPDYLELIEKTTGLKVSIRTLKILPTMYGQDRDVAESYLNYLDPISNLNINIKVTHSIVRPEFFDENELTVVIGFSVTLFLMNLLLVSKLTAPIVNARNAFIEFSQHGKALPEEQQFVSKEMKQFSSTINSLINEINENRKELRWQSEHDYLTGLANKRLLDKLTSEWINDPKISHLTFFMIDIDFFKSYNDHYGHLAGDQALERVAKQLSQSIFSENQVAARFGGEEFCLVIASATYFDSLAIAKQLHKNISRLGILHEHSTVSELLTISIGGVQCINSSNESYQSLIHKADIELYKVKNNGRNSTSIIDGN